MFVRLRGRGRGGGWYEGTLNIAYIPCMPQSKTTHMSEKREKLYREKEERKKEKKSDKKDNKGWRIPPPLLPSNPLNDLNIPPLLDARAPDAAGADDFLEPAEPTTAEDDEVDLQEGRDVANLLGGGG